MGAFPYAPNSFSVLARLVYTSKKVRGFLESVVSSDYGAPQYEAISALNWADLRTGATQDGRHEAKDGR